MKTILKEFKTFALKGNVMQLAVGVIIGGAFQSVVTSLTENILSPIIGLFAKQNFDELSVEFLGITLRYGAFITVLINFLIMAFVVFLLVKGMNKLLTMNEKKEEPAVQAPTTKQCPYCKTSIDISATRCPACTSEVGAEIL